MPKYSNYFGSPKYVEQEVFSEDGKKIGTIRIKPGGVSWKPANKQQFHSVVLDDFIKWITTEAPSKRLTKS